MMLKLGRARRRASNWLRDLWDGRVRRLCLDVPSRGWRHWRCGRPRGHMGAHRFINYRWPDGGSVEYDPLPPGSARIPAPSRYL